MFRKSLYYWLENHCIIGEKATELQVRKPL